MTMPPEFLAMLQIPVKRAAGNSNRGRKATTGRFETREELVRKVRTFWHNTDMSMEAIGRNCKISASTVERILNEPRPPQ